MVDSSGFDEEHKQRLSNIEANVNNINISVAKIHSNVEHHNGNFLKFAEATNKILEKHSEKINKVDVLTTSVEDIEERSKFSVKVLWGAIAGFFGKIFYDVFTSK
tara:strand:+ start:30 stop:344 length:315 start_codon:yes stop_codon:yes gene_type:complete